MPTRSQQPPPPRRLKLPTVSHRTLKDLANRRRVVNIDDILHPRPLGESRGGADQLPVASSAAEYLRRVGIIVAYRSYFFPPAAVQWAMYAVWLQGHAVSAPLATLRKLDHQGRTHLATYPGDYHSPADLTESVQTLLMAPASRPLAPAPRSVPGVRLAPRAARPEPCFRWNGGRCSNNAASRRAHVCLDCGGPHQARVCRAATGNALRPLPPPPPAGRF